MPKRLLITGFDPFGGQSVNPAWEAVSRLPARVGFIHVPFLPGQAGQGQPSMALDDIVRALCAAIEAL